MPDDESTTDEPQPSELEISPEREQAPPGYVLREDYDRLTQQFEQLRSNQEILTQNVLRSQIPQQQPRGPQRVSDEQIQEMIDAGQTADAVRLLAREVANNELRPELDQLRNVGLASLERIAKRDGASGKKHYQRFAKEIEEYMSQLPQESRVMPEFYEMAYNIVVGKNMDKLTQEALEAAQRQRETASVPDEYTGSRRRSRTPKGEVPQPEDLFDDDVLASLAQKGGPDGWAQKMGYDNWNDYAKDTEWNEEWLAEYNTTKGGRH